MRTRLISVLLAASLAATAPLGPAQAQNFSREAQNRAAAIVVGLATIALIAKAAEARADKEKKKKKEKDKDDRAKPPRTHKDDDRKEPVIARADRPLPRVYPRGEYKPSQHQRALSVPSSCARKVQTNSGVRTAFGAPCLRRAGVNLKRLPDRCRRLADVGHRDVRIWGARCLRRNGVWID